MLKSIYFLQKEHLMSINVDIKEVESKLNSIINSDFIEINNGKVFINNVDLVYYLKRIY